MKRGGALERRTSLKRTGFRRTPSRRERAHRDRMDALRPLVFERAGYVCEARTDRCFTFATEAHHVLARSAGGADSLENLVALCLGCHAYVHAHPAWARSVGLLRSRYGQRLR